MVGEQLYDGVVLLAVDADVAGPAAAFSFLTCEFARHTVFTSGLLHLTVRILQEVGGPQGSLHVQVGTLKQAVILGLIVVIEESFHLTQLCGVSFTDLYLDLSAVMHGEATVLFTTTLFLVGSLVLALHWLGNEDLGGEAVHIHQVHIWGPQELHLLAQVCQVFCEVGLFHTEDLE